MHKIMHQKCVDLDCLKLFQCVNTRGNMFKTAKESSIRHKEVFFTFKTLTSGFFYLMMLNIKIVIC